MRKGRASVMVLKLLDEIQQYRLECSSMRVTVNTDSTHEMVLSMLKRKIGSGGGTRALLRYVFIITLVRPVGL